jgi:16S rRNA processing protein RimM
VIWDEMAVVGRIARAHGNKGQVIVNLETDFPEQRFRVGAELFVQRQAGTSERIVIATVRFQQQRPVIGIAGVETMNDAEALAGLELRVPREGLVTLPPGMYYHHDLVGCRVETTAGAVVGTVAAIEESAGGNHLVVDGARGEILVPLAPPICRAVDIAAKQIVIAPPDGLLELNEKSRAQRPPDDTAGQEPADT